MSDAQELATRHMAAIAAAVVIVVAVPLGIAKGAPAVVLWMAFALLSGAVLLFWETLRLVLDPAQPGDADEGDDDGAALGALESRKRAALQALRDLEFERSIGRIGEEDHRALEARYRAEARDAMKAIDEGIGPWRARAAAMLAEAEGAAPDADAKTETATSEAATAAPADAGSAGVCPKCETSNDDDAVFCKRCGHRMKEEVGDATA